MTKLLLILIATNAVSLTCGFVIGRRIYRSLGLEKQTALVLQITRMRRQLAEKAHRTDSLQRHRNHDLRRLKQRERSLKLLPAPAKS
ncbi:MAG: hypothetical protein ACFB6R_09905 [Alphaproteobacteria bacterium]